MTPRTLFSVSEVKPYQWNLARTDVELEEVERWIEEGQEYFDGTRREEAATVATVYVMDAEDYVTYATARGAELLGLRVTKNQSTSTGAFDSQGAIRRAVQLYHKQVML